MESVPGTGGTSPRCGSACPSACPPYTLGGVSPPTSALSVGEALLAILLANLVVLIPLTLNAFAGTRYGIPSGVAARFVRHHRLQRAMPDPRRGRAAGSASRRCSARAGDPSLPRFDLSRLEAPFGGTGEVIGFLLFWG